MIQKKLCILRISHELHQRAKLRACEENKTLQDWIELVLTIELKRSDYYKSRKDSMKTPCES